MSDDDPRQKRKAILHELSRSMPSLLITSGIALAGLFLWYLLYGSCGYVSVKSSIKDMNTIMYGWQELRDAIIPEFSINGAVTYETVAMMEEWRTLAYQLQVPSCLATARSTLIDSIESDIQTFKLAKDRISIDQKLEYLSSNTAFFVRYKEYIDLIETCTPTCNVGTDFYNLFEALHP